MKLYDAEFAPSPRRVRVFLAEKGIEVPTRQISLREGEQLSEEYLRINPCATVPCLQLDDGTVINQIPSICLYFEEEHPEPPLMGVDARDKAVVNMWDRRMELEGMLAAAEGFRNSHPAFKDRALTGPRNYAQIPELAERGRQRYQDFLAMLDEHLGESTYVAGERFTIADITALATVDFAQAVKVGAPDGHANVQRWHEAVSARPSAAA